MNSSNRILRIAVADDDPPLRDFFKRALAVLGHRVVVLAANGEELVLGCRKCQPDLIITDVHMPRLNGVEAVKRIWQIRQVPAIFMTGLPDAELFKGCAGASTPLCLMKPVPLVDLGQAIATCRRAV